MLREKGARRLHRRTGIGPSECAEDGGGRFTRISLRGHLADPGAVAPADLPLRAVLLLEALPGALPRRIDLDAAGWVCRRAVLSEGREDDEKGGEGEEDGSCGHAVHSRGGVCGLMAADAEALRERPSEAEALDGAALRGALVRVFCFSVRCYIGNLGLGKLALGFTYQFGTNQSPVAPTDPPGSMETSFVFPVLRSRM